MSDSNEVQFPPQVVQALEKGDKIEAIKLLRHHSGLGLKDSKDAVEAYLGNHESTRKMFESHAQSRSGCGGAASLFLITLSASMLLPLWF